MLTSLKALLVVGSLLALTVAFTPQAAFATCSTYTETGAQQSAGTSEYYGGWLNIYNENHLGSICSGTTTYDFLNVAMPSLSYINFGFAQPYNVSSSTSYFFSTYAVYPSSPLTTQYGTASTAATYSIRVYDLGSGQFKLDETGGSTFSTVDISPYMDGDDTGKISGYVERAGSGDASLSTNFSDTQNRSGGGWGYWTNEVCAVGSNITDWKVNFGTNGAFDTSNFTHTGAC